MNPYRKYPREAERHANKYRLLQSKVQYPISLHCSSWFPSLYWSNYSFIVEIGSTSSLFGNIILIKSMNTMNKDPNVKNVNVNPPKWYSADPIIGPIINPMPVTASMYPTSASF